MTTTKPPYSLTKITGQNIDRGLSNEILALQKANQFDPSRPLDKGFLFTIWTPKELQGYLETGATLFVYRDIKDQRLIAYVFFTPISVLSDSYLKVPDAHSDLKIDDLASTIYLYQIAILPELRRAGIGTKLLNTILQDYKNHDVYLDLMESPHFNQASFYFFQKLGFKRCANVEFKDYRGWGECKWLVMKKTF